MTFQQFITQCCQRIDQSLEQHIRQFDAHPHLLDAMRYSLFNGGKRIRPTLVYASAQAVADIMPCTERAAMAVEAIHAYSLIHDDLPAMDDDDLRRGKPTCHIAFDEATAMSAMGCALAQCAGVMQAHVEGKPTLPVQIAGAARAAVVACDLAENGLNGPESSLEGPYGYFAMFEDEANAELSAKRLGKIHRITEVSWKPFPTGRAAQGGIVLVQKIMEQGASFENVKQLTLLAPPIIPRLVERPIVDNMTANYARLCFPYLAPIALKRGTIGLRDFTPQDLHDPEIRAFSKLVEVKTNHITDPAEFVPQTLTARLENGSILEASIDTLFGSPSDPLTREQHLEKFRNCLAFGLRDINADDVGNRLIDLMEGIEELSDVSIIFELAVG